jgi:hypothetical protein
VAFTDLKGGRKVEANTRVACFYFSGQGVRPGVYDDDDGQFSFLLTTPTKT